MMRGPNSLPVGSSSSTTAIAYDLQVQQLTMMSLFNIGTKSATLITRSL